MKKQIVVMLSIILVASIILLSVFNLGFSKKPPKVPKKVYVSVSPPAFNPHNEYQQYNRGGFYLEGSGPYSANVQLPNGVTLTNFTVYLYDNTASYGMQVRLLIHDLQNFDWDILASIDTYPATETPGRVTLRSSIPNVEVNNQLYSYYITVHFDIDGFTSELSLQGVVIEYQE